MSKRLNSQNKVLVYHRGQYWWWDGEVDYKGRYGLVSVSNSSVGIIADPKTSLVKIVRGKEYDNQVNAINYFKTIEGCIF